MKETGKIKKELFVLGHYFASNGFEQLFYALITDQQEKGILVHNTIRLREYFMVIYSKLKQPQHNADDLTMLLSHLYELECTFSNEIDSKIWFDFKRTILTQICIAFLFDQLGTSDVNRYTKHFKLDQISTWFDYPLFCAKVAALYTHSAEQRFRNLLTIEEHYILSNDIAQITTSLLVIGKSPLQLDICEVNNLLGGFQSPSDFPPSFADELKTIEHQVLGVAERPTIEFIN